MNRDYAVLAAALLTLVPFGDAAFAQSKGIDEHFNTTWAPTSNPNSYGEPTDGIFKVDGTYCVPYGGNYTNELNVANATLTQDSVGSLLHLTIQPGTHTSKSCGGVTAYGAAEIATAAGWTPGSGPPPFGTSSYGYGYYETKMKPSCVQGESSSFFWIAAPSYGPLELDVEFPDPPGHNFTDVHWTIHPSGQTVDYQLGFNPCQAFHRYGFLWTPGKIVFTVDGRAKQTFTDGTLISTETGFLMANAITGIPNWGDGPPSQAAVNSYRWIAYHPNITTIPPH